MTEQAEKALPYDIVEYTWEQIANQRQAEIARLRAQRDQLLAAVERLKQIERAAVRVLDECEEDKSPSLGALARLADAVHENWKSGRAAMEKKP